MTDWLIQHPIAIGWLLIFFIIGAIIGIALLVNLLTGHKEQKTTPAPPEPDSRYTLEGFYQKIEMYGESIRTELTTLRVYIQENLPARTELPVKFVDVASKQLPPSEESSDLYVGDADE